MRRRALLSCATALVASWVIPALGGAQEKHFQVALIAPTIQLVDDDEDIRGFRLNLYGKNANVYGMDLGIVNHVDQEMRGWQVGLVNLVEESFTGWQAGVVNVSEGNFLGFQGGPWPALVNIAGTGEGAQIGVFNRAERFEGFQLALVNFAEDMYGLQIGLINIIRSKESFPVLPIVNWNFE